MKKSLLERQLEFLCRIAADFYKTAAVSDKTSAGIAIFPSIFGKIGLA